MTTLYKTFSFEDALALILLGRHPLYAVHIIKLHLSLGCGCVHCYKQVLEVLIDDYGISSYELHEMAIREARTAGMEDEEIEEIDVFFRRKGKK